MQLARVNNPFPMLMSVCPFLLHEVIPSEPRDAVASFVTNISAVISWSPPAAIGTETDVLYDIECQKTCDYYGKSCDDEECHGVVSFLFQMEELNMTNITITNLASFVNYTCKISAKNRVSKVAERNHGVKGNFALVNLRTNGTGRLLRRSNTHDSL